MPWSNSNVPASMKYLRPEVRGKAIEIANALLASGTREDHAIRIAIAQAKRWWMHRRESRLATAP